MSRSFLLKEIALQAAVSEATVDRVLNGRGGVRQQTADRVRNAMADLERQSARMAVRGRKLVVDLVVEAPRAFLDALQVAVDDQLDLMQGTVFHLRRNVRTDFAPREMERALSRIARLGSDAVILMGPDAAPVRNAITRLAEANIPVIALTTDIPASVRRAYVGLDNLKAGRAAAWFLRKWLPGETAHVIVTLRNVRFHGEMDRQRGFLDAMAQVFKAPQVTLLNEGAGNHDIAELVAEAVEATGDVAAIYSIGGSNRRMIDALDAIGFRTRVFLGHDLDAENCALLREGRIDVVFYHDLREDIRTALLFVLSLVSKGRISPPKAGAALRVMTPPMMD